MPRMSVARKCWISMLGAEARNLLTPFFSTFTLVVSASEVVAAFAAGTALSATLTSAPCAHASDGKATMVTATSFITRDFIVVSFDAYLDDVISKDRVITG